MADLKISQLTASTTPLAGTEVLPIVQSSTTKQVSVANLTAGRAVSASSLTASTGDITATAGNFIPSTAAKGVNFTANTPQAGMTSQLLNWYEEGTFTPTLSGATTTTYTTQTGRYTRVGRLVTFQCELQINSVGNGSTTTFVLGTLPAAGVFSTISVGFFSTIATSVVFLSGYVNSGANSVTLQSLTAANTASGSNAIFGNSARIIVSGQYSV
jgi:hypothetical protein